MSEYVDRGKIGLTDFEIIMCDGNYKEAFKMLSRKIEALPSADVHPVKHGRWIQDEHTYSGCWTYNYVCSACGEIGGSWLRNIRRDQMFPYCPFCGAKMDEEDDND